MVTKQETTGIRGFSIELNSGNDLQRVSVPNGNQRILVEGTIGTLRRVELVENSVLEVTGSSGVLRVDLSAEDLAKYTSKKKGVKQR